MIKTNSLSFKTIKEHLLAAPDSQLDAQMFPLIEKWDEPVKAIQVLEVLDWCIFCSLASGLVVRLLRKLYKEALLRENTTDEEMIKLITWRTI
jgi:hypothetical protein